ncbi:DUF4238 domain-containing protein [Chryseobacterium defluvii]|uniref:Uncharacterized protein DUF4238 n=1 Tax=Chryseobacterium defluvii TaxID=160396 RepID=A0A495SP44_9FLAO|nr:DUF4238 domain-containing protein [Chryseobacterium defluvii]RKT01807.1 uncharacterized protein DUF4238 [Chryseobacterium defluvii]
MSIPKNHHYISQIHIKNFFNKEDGGIYLYDKNQNNLFKSNGTRNIFSEKNLNTIRLSENDLDYTSIENELNDKFEKDFNRHLETIVGFIDSHQFSTEVDSALMYFARYGVIGEFRTPDFKRRMDDAIFNGMKDIMEHAVDGLKDKFFKAFKFDEEVKYTNTNNFDELADNIIETMGEMSWVLQVPKNQEDYFLLGDFGAATVRDKINVYFNPDVKEIAYIGFPLSSKIYLHLYSTKWSKSPQESIIQILSSAHVYEINKANFMYAKKLIACENEIYLQNFIFQVRKDLGM